MMTQPYKNPLITLITLITFIHVSVMHVMDVFFTRALGHVMGDYCTTMDTSTIMAKAHVEPGAARPDLVALKGARLILASELNAGQRLNEAGVKLLTGQDTVTARDLFRSNFTFEMTGKIFLACNHLPGVQGQDQGIWRRIRLVPFRYIVPAEMRDNDLDAKLQREAKGILAWLVRGCLEWVQSGRLPKAQAVAEASDEYRQTSDTLGGFLTECVVRMPAAKAQGGPLYKAYEAYTTGSGERPVSPKRLAEMLVERGFTKTTARGLAYWHGLQLKGPVGGGSGSTKLPPIHTHGESMDDPLPPPHGNPADDPEEAAMLDAERAARDTQ